MLPQRKHPRLKKFDYSSPGAYFVTICTDRRKKMFCTVEKGQNGINNDLIHLTSYGEIVDAEIKAISNRFGLVDISRYVIMPNHIHLLIEIRRGENVSTPSPAITDMICMLKSIVTRKIKTIGFKDKVFQTSFYEHIIRNKNDYEQTVKYILENPINWYYDELYVD